MGQPPSVEHAFHWTDMEVEDVASTDTMVGAESANVCVMGKYSPEEDGCIFNRKYIHLTRN